VRQWWGKWFPILSVLTSGGFSDNVHSRIHVILLDYILIPLSKPQVPDDGHSIDPQRDLSQRSKEAVPSRKASFGQPS
jgi:hypothetical protein